MFHKSQLCMNQQHGYIAKTYDFDRGSSFKGHIWIESATTEEMCLITSLQHITFCENE